MTIYVVIGHCGRYEEYRETLVRAYETEAEAIEEVAALEAALRDSPDTPQKRRDRGGFFVASVDLMPKRVP